VKPISFLIFFLFIFFGSLCAQPTDTIPDIKAPIAPAKAGDTVKVAAVSGLALKFQHKLLNINAEPVSLPVNLKTDKSDNTFFYLLAVVVLVLAFLKYIFSRYFTNLFRVFFNTSLRQNQITDQLLQAKLPSFLFNIFFVISAGIYAYLILLQYGLFIADNKWVAVFSSIGLMGILYFTKYCTLKFTGWLTGLTEVVDIYVFMIFLINKIIGILLVPFIVILAFADVPIVKIATLVSIISIGIFLLLRFFRSYGLVQNQLKISKFHFILYIISLEILPLMLIYKGLMIYLTKKL
jgi:Domain of unknown function (DUF4271)